MANSSQAIRNSFDAYLDSIDTDGLLDLVFQENEITKKFGSQDFILNYVSISSGEPEGCRIIEMRINPSTQNKALMALLKSSKNMALNSRALSLALVDGKIMDPRLGKGDAQAQAHHVELVATAIKTALRESPIKDYYTVINKIHLHLVDGRLSLTAISWPGYDIEGNLLPPPAVVSKKTGENAKFLAKMDKKHGS